MHSRHLARTAGLGLAVAAALGCSEPTAPSSIAGTYALADARLPVHLYTNEFGAWFATADTLRFTVDGKGTESGTRYIVPSVTGLRADTATNRGTEFSFRVVGGSAEVSFPCPPNANCAPSPHMIVTRTASGIHVTYPNSIQPPQDYVDLRGVP